MRNGMEMPKRTRGKPLKSDGLRRSRGNVDYPVSTRKSLRDSRLNVEWNLETDVVVVGFGGAGASAAIEAFDCGAQVLIIEKAPGNLPGGNTGCCAGYMMVPSSVEEGIEYYRSLGFGTVRNEKLIHAMAREMHGIRHWLADQGVPLEIVECGIPGTFPILPGSRVDRIRVQGGGYIAFQILAKRVQERGINVIYDTRTLKLIQNHATAEIRGVICKNDDGDLFVKARRGVVLACGGYQNNPDMLSNFNYPGVGFYNLGTPYNTGDGIFMSSEVGAKLWHMASLELANFAIKLPSDLFKCAAALASIPRIGSYIFVNKYGKRFMPESRRVGHYKGDIEACIFDHFRAEYPNMPLYLIFDESFRKAGPLVPEQSIPPQKLSWLTVHDLYKWSTDNREEIDRGWIVEGDTVEMVAEKLGIDPVGLAETVRNYNDYCQQGRDPECGRNPEHLLPITTSPFYGTELCVNLVNTQGGPVHDEASRVIGVNDEPIPRLFAAGELGSFFGHLYQGGSNFPEALAFGRIAGRNAALALAEQNP